MTRQGPVVVGVGGQHSGFWFALPWLVGVIGLTLVPMAFSVLLSFTRWDGPSLSHVRWAGSAHYVQALRVDREHRFEPQDPWYWTLLGGRPADEQFYQALYNSA